MPAQWVKDMGPKAEKAWKRAEGIVREQYPELAQAADSDEDSEEKSQFYAFVTAIFKKVCKGEKYDCDRTYEGTMSTLNRVLRRVEEASATKNSGPVNPKRFMGWCASAAAAAEDTAKILRDLSQGKAQANYGVTESERDTILRLRDNTVMEFNSWWDRILKNEFNIKD
jgi:hypothetical protein